MAHKFQYFEHLSSKTEFLNFFRNFLKSPCFESFLIAKTRGKDPSFFWSKFVPPEYLYRKGSKRSAIINTIKYDLDLSDTVDHFIYFRFSDAAFERIKSYVKETSVIIDIGANIGRFSLVFAKLAKEGTVIGYEPDPGNFSKLSANIKLNNFRNVTIVNKALGDVSCVKQLFKVNQHNAGMNRFSLDDSDLDLAFVQTEVTTLDIEVEEKNFGRIDIIKIDVEGFEYKTLVGAEKSIDKYRPILFLELVDENLRDNQDTPEKLVAWVRSKNYKIYKAGSMEPINENYRFLGCHFDILCLPV